MPSCRHLHLGRVLEKPKIKTYLLLLVDGSQFFYWDINITLFFLVLFCCIRTYHAAAGPEGGLVY